MYILYSPFELPISIVKSRNVIRKLIHISQVQALCLNPCEGDMRLGQRHQHGTSLNHLARRLHMGYQQLAACGAGIFPFFTPLTFEREFRNMVSSTPELSRFKWEQAVFKLMPPQPHNIQSCVCVGADVLYAMWVKPKLTQTSERSD